MLGYVDFLTDILRIIIYIIISNIYKYLSLLVVKKTRKEEKIFIISSLNLDRRTIVLNFKINSPAISPVCSLILKP